MTTIAPQTQTFRNHNAPKPDEAAFLAQLRPDPLPTAAPTAAPTGSPSNSGSVRIGGSGLNFPMSNFDPEVAPYVSFFDTMFQSRHSDGLPMSVGGMTVQEYGLIRNRLERTPQTLEEMDQARQDIEKLVRTINIAGGEGMEIPDDIKKRLEQWRQEDSDPLMSQQPNDIPGLTRSNNGVQFPTPQQGPQSRQPAGGFPTSGNPFGFNAGSASGPSGAQGAGGGGSATERKLRDLLDKLGANDPTRDVYEILTEVIRNAIDNNTYAHPNKAAIVREIASILSTENTGYANSSIPELLRITDTPEAREAHALSVEFERMQPEDVQSITRNGEKVASFMKKPNGDFVMQALKPVHVRLPNGEAAMIEPNQTHTLPRGSLVTIPGMAPIEIGRDRRQPTVVYPSEELGLTQRVRPSLNAVDYGAPLTISPPLQDPSPGAGPDASSSEFTPPELDPKMFELAPPNTESVVPDIGATNRRYDSVMRSVKVTLNNRLTPEEKAAEAAKAIDRLPPEEQAFVGHMASRWAEAILSTDDFNRFIQDFDAHRQRWQGGESGGKSDDKRMGGSSSKPDLTSMIGDVRLIGRLERLREVLERNGGSEQKLAVLEKGIQILSGR